MLVAGGLGNLRPDAYQAVVSALESWNSEALAEVALCEACYCDELTTAVSDYPNIVFEFATAASGTVKLPLSPQVYLGTTEYASRPRCHLGLQAAQSNANAIFGNVFLSQFHVIFDRGQNQIGFSMPDATQKLKTCGCVYGRRHLQECECDYWKTSAVSGPSCDTMTSEAAKYYTVYERILNPTSEAASASDPKSGSAGSSGDKLSTGEIIGIAVSCVAALVIVGTVAFYFKRVHPHHRRLSAGSNLTETLVENDASSNYVEFTQPDALPLLAQATQ